jgi:hypothetical protein
MEALDKSGLKARRESWGESIVFVTTCINQNLSYQAYSSFFGRFKDCISNNKKNYGSARQYANIPFSLVLY